MKKVTTKKKYIPVKNKPKSNRRIKIKEFYGSRYLNKIISLSHLCLLYFRHLVSLIAVS